MANARGVFKVSPKKQLSSPAVEDIPLSMANESFLSSAANDLWKSRGWLILCGILSIVVGFSAMGSPLLFSLVIARFLSIFLLVSGIISLVLAIAGKHKGHRVMEALSGPNSDCGRYHASQLLALQRGYCHAGCAIYLVAEGVSMAVTAFGMRGTPGWAWMLLSGLISDRLRDDGFQPLAVRQHRNPGPVFRYQPPL